MSERRSSVRALEEPIRQIARERRPRRLHRCGQGEEPKRERSASTPRPKCMRTSWKTALSTRPRSPRLALQNARVRCEPHADHRGYGRGEAERERCSPYARRRNAPGGMVLRREEGGKESGEGLFAKSPSPDPSPKTPTILGHCFASGEATAELTFGAQLLQQLALCTQKHISRGGLVRS